MILYEVRGKLAFFLPPPLLGLFGLIGAVPGDDKISELLHRETEERRMSLWIFMQNIEGMVGYYSFFWILRTIKVIKVANHCYRL